MLSKVTQKLHTKNQHSQVVDFVDYFSRVTIEEVQILQQKRAEVQEIIAKHAPPERAQEAELKTEPELQQNEVPQNQVEAEQQPRTAAELLQDEDMQAIIQTLSQQDINRDRDGDGKVSEEEKLENIVEQMEAGNLKTLDEKDVSDIKRLVDGKVLMTFETLSGGKENAEEPSAPATVPSAPQRTEEPSVSR